MTELLNSAKRRLSRLVDKDAPMLQFEAEPTLSSSMPSGIVGDSDRGLELVNLSPPWAALPTTGALDAMSTNKPDIPPSTPREVDEFVANVRATRPMAWYLLERLRAALRRERPADITQRKRPESPLDK